MNGQLIDFLEFLNQFTSALYSIYDSIQDCYFSICLEIFKMKLDEYGCDLVEYYEIENEKDIRKIILN